MSISESRNLIFRLDLAPFAGFTILQAQMAAYQYDGSNDLPMEVRAYPVTEDWNHSWVTWDERDNGRGGGRMGRPGGNSELPVGFRDGVRDDDGRLGW